MKSGAKQQRELPFVVLGNPEGRRVSLFQAALERAGRPQAHVVSWEAFLRDERALADVPFDACIFRIDSAGQNFEVERALLRRGFEAARAADVWTMDPHEIDALEEDRGRILAPRQHHLGFVDALERVEAIARERPGWVVPSTPASIRECFDKRATWRRCVALGVPVPDAIEEPVDDLATLVAAMRARGWERSFVKVSCESSASCLAIVSIRGGRTQAVTTVEDTGERLYNTRRLQLVRERRSLERLLRLLLREGSQIEREVPKARLDGLEFDCRVVVIDAEPSFVVVRQSKHSITNLHLGGSRGDLDVLRAACQPSAYASMLGSARALARAIGAFQVGVDVMLEEDFLHHRVLEANAFGDLLPNLSRDGLAVYDWQIRALRNG